MTLEEIKLRRLAGQHLLAPADTQTVVKDLCGVQAQFLSHALHGLSIRCIEVNTDGLIKSWTNRGTMHLFSVDDLPLFLHEGRSHFLRPVDTLESDAYISADRKAYFADRIVDAVSHGIDEREALKTVCEKAGMTESEGQCLFDPWGGTIRALCEAGRLCHKVQEKKAYQLCPDFEPMAEEHARLELARRYFTHFGPATVKDAAYFFGTTQTKVKSLLKQLPVTETILDGKSYFYIDNGLPANKLPACRTGVRKTVKSKNLTIYGICQMGLVNNNEKMSDARSKARASLIFYLNTFFDITEEHTMQELNYIRCGDYYIPDLRLPEENRPIGRFGRMHRDYLREHNPIRFGTMCLDGTLWSYLADLNEQAQKRLEVIIEQMKAVEGVTEEMKATDQMAWVG